MPKLKIDGQEVEFTPGMTIIQVCEQVGTEIPRFCYHEKLKIAGNCRMCLVEVKPGPPKPQASCALPAAENMEVFTSTPMVKKAREGVMEFLLINHPLDCPICDQGGECDLQDQAMAYGKDKSRYREHKRAVEDKYMGPIIKTDMNRCIHCTRCVRFVEEVAGVPDLGATGRGEDMEITTYVEKAVSSELSGNVVDLCPVGALTSKPYAFIARPWELEKTESIDVMDAVGCNIRVDARGNAVLRILPRLNEDINEEWISDKTRHACDGLRLQRLDRPFIRRNGVLKPATWQEAFALIAEKVKATAPEKIAALAGNLVGIESMVALRDVMLALGSHNMDCRQDGAKIDATARSNYLFNTTIAGLEQADLILLVGANPRYEAPLVNARIRKRWMQGGLKVLNLGNPHDLTYPAEELGQDPSILLDMAKGSHKVVDALKAAKNPVIIIGTSALARPDGIDILAAARHIASTTPVSQPGWNGFNILHHAAARVGGLDIGFLPHNPNGRDIEAILDGAKNGDTEILYLLGVDEIDPSLFGKAFVIYQGHHGDLSAERADVILPGAAYTEQDATFVNLEGRAQRAFRAVFPPGEAKEDWKIIRALSEALGVALPYNTLDEVRARMEEIAPHLAMIDEIVPAEWQDVRADLPAVRIGKEPFEEMIRNFYMTDAISRVSQTMASCMREITGPETKAAA